MPGSSRKKNSLCWAAVFALYVCLLVFKFAECFIGSDVEGFDNIILADSTINVELIHLRPGEKHETLKSKRNTYTDILVIYVPIVCLVDVWGIQV